MIGDFLKAVAQAAFRATANSLLNSPGQAPSEHFVKVSWANAMNVALPAERCRVLMVEFFRDYAGGRLEAQTATHQLFSRGDRRITELPTSRPVGWGEIPLTIYLDYQEGEQRTRVAISYLSREGVRFNQACVDFFHAQAEHEFDQVFNGIADAAERYQKARTRRPAGDGTAQTTDAQTAADLASLALKAPSSWPEIQAAYRDACLKFHPDRLGGQNVPRHLIDLAVGRFKEITDAYQRLKRGYSNG